MSKKLMIHENTTIYFQLKCSVMLEMCVPNSFFRPLNWLGMRIPPPRSPSHLQPAAPCLEPPAMLCHFYYAEDTVITTTSAHFCTDVQGGPKNGPFLNRVARFPKPKYGRLFFP